MRRNGMKFDGHRYIGCRWCGGRGCLQCESEADKAYRREFPDGPKPIATFKTDDPVDMERFRSIFGPDALQQTFGPEGRGMAEIHEKLRGETPEQPAPTQTQKDHDHGQE